MKLQMDHRTHKILRIIPPGKKSGSHFIYLQHEYR